MKRAKAFGTHKYHAIRTTVDGHVFASKAEAARYETLRDMQAAGQIERLVLQPKFRLETNGVHVCDYVADFGYLTAARGLVVEDVKSPATMTPVFRLKKKLMAAVLGVEIICVDRHGNVKPARKPRAQGPRKQKAVK